MHIVPTGYMLQITWFCCSIQQNWNIFTCNFQANQYHQDYRQNYNPGKPEPAIAIDNNPTWLLKFPLSLVLKQEHIPLSPSKIKLMVGGIAGKRLGRNAGWTTVSPDDVRGRTNERVRSSPAPAARLRADWVVEGRLDAERSRNVAEDPWDMVLLIV